MARFLSATWFDDVARHSDGEPANVAAGRVAVTPVLTQVVTDTPDGEVRYQIVIEAGSLRVHATGDGGVNGIAAADREGAKEITDPLTFTSDYANGFGDRPRRAVNAGGPARGPLAGLGQRHRHRRAHRALHGHRPAPRRGAGDDDLLIRWAPRTGGARQGRSASRAVGTRTLTTRPGYGTGVGAGGAAGAVGDRRGS